MSLLTYFTAAQNPVARAEFRHQRYVLETSRSGRLWIGLALVMLIPALLASIVVFVHGMIAPFLTQEWALMADQPLMTYGFAMLMTMNVALYVVVILITTGLGARSITREKAGRTWETLLLTNIDARQIVWGKWWATIRAMWGDQLMVAILRFGFFAWIIESFSQLSPQPALPFDFPAQPVHVFLFVVIGTLYTLFDAAFTSALGVFLPLPDWHTSITLTLLFGLRVLASMLGGAWFIWMFVDFFNTQQWHYISIGVLGLLAYMVAIWAVLRLAQVVAVQGQASPPAKPAAGE